MDGDPTPVVIRQAHFEREGFASTVWDSSIVVSKLLEHGAARVSGRRLCDVSAGTGLVGARLGGRSSSTCPHVTDLACVPDGSREAHSLAQSNPRHCPVALQAFQRVRRAEGAIGMRAAKRTMS